MATTRYTFHKDKVSAALPLKTIVTVILSNPFLCETPQYTALYKVLHRIFGSTL
jgi:hypothetical protein